MKGLLVLFDHTEDSEALTTTALLRRAGLKVDTVTQNQNKVVTTAYKQKVIADYTFNEINYETYDFLIIPGGPYVSKILHTEKELLKIIQYFYKEDKLIAAICAAPAFLGVLGLLDGKNFTCFPSFERNMPKGKYKPLEKVVVDNNIITARSAGAVTEFSYHIIEKLYTTEKAVELLKEIIY